MNVYISSHDEKVAAELAATLAKYGHTIASRWVSSPANIRDADDGTKTVRVLDNIEDIKDCDVLVVLAAPDGELVPGGKHFETGYAIAKHRRVYVVGRRENLYHWHPAIFHVADTRELLNKLGG